MPGVTRRRALIGCSAAAASLAACATARPTPAQRPIEVAPGVYMVAGSGGAADEDNLGRIGNAGFVVGELGVIAIDTGTSHAHGQALLAAIRDVTDQPVRVALVTHTQPEFVFGGMAFRERGIPIRMHSRNAGLMASRCETCLKTLRQTLGEEPMRSTTLYKADQVFDATHELDGIGRPVQVLYFGHSSGPGDIAVLDRRSAVLFAGGLLEARRVPDIQDSDLAGWHTALNELQALQVATVVPGHGAAATPALPLIATNRRYLMQLESRIRTLVASGASLLQVADATELPEFETWDQYDTIHRRNASVAYLRVERELMLK
ncbi:MAG TPA: MBL fold metallo-hydrolase [Burkholderiaceae bacterium]|nr:MBL fold metallo-hydrolase [Burkholderiaceae bacterium]